MDSHKIIIPELVVFSVLKQALKVLRKDFAQNQADEKKSILYLMLQENSLQRYGYFEQAKEVFITNGKMNEPRFVDVNMGWNIEKIQKSFPCIHIMMGSENPNDDSLGIGSGNVLPVYDEAQKTYGESYQRTFKQNCQLMITTDNSNETILIYHILKSLIVTFIPTFESQGFRNISISGDDVNLNRDVPDAIMVRRVSMTFDFSMDIPSLYKKFYATGFRFTGTQTTE